MRDFRDLNSVEKISKLPQPLTSIHGGVESAFPVKPLEAGL
jgi:hypothetical protein